MSFELFCKDMLSVLQMENEFIVRRSKNHSKTTQTCNMLLSQQRTDPKRYVERIKNKKRVLVFGLVREVGARIKPKDCLSTLIHAILPSSVDANTSASRLISRGGLATDIQERKEKGIDYKDLVVLLHRLKGR